jgi:GNAT superfamily N-acetyltransferase
MIPFALTKELVDQILYGMENQDYEYCLDVDTAQVVRCDQCPNPDDPESCIAIPEWRPVDGFNIMESFLSGLRNPVYRENLRQILASGHKVFRRFKDTVRQNREIERQWFVHKERRMQAVVYEWYNQLREVWGLDPIVPDYPDNEDLVLFDFSLRRLNPTEEAELTTELRGYDEGSFVELHRELPEAVVEHLYTRYRAGLPDIAELESFVLVVETPTEDVAGFLWAVEEDLDDGSRMSTLAQLYVLPEYRGLGIARTALPRYLQQAHGRGVGSVVVEVQAEARNFAGYLESEGFRSAAAAYALNLRRWWEENLPG